MGEKIVTLHPPAPGIKYTEAERDTVYQTWVLCGKNLTETSRRTGVPRETIGAWRDQHDWYARYQADAAEIASSFGESVGAFVAIETPRSLEVIREIRDDPTADKRTRLQAAQWIAGIGGIGPVSKIEQAVTVKDPTAPKQTNVIDISGSSPDDLLRLESDYRSKRRRE